MNDLKRQERRKLNDRRDEQRREFTELPQINRAHRACEGECIELKKHINVLYLFLAQSGFTMANMNDFIEAEFNYRNDEADILIAEIDAILPATEVYNENKA